MSVNKTIAILFCAFFVFVVNIAHVAVAWQNNATRLRRLAPECKILWDNTGQQGDTVIVTLRPTNDDIGPQKMLAVALLLEVKPQGTNQWLPANCTPEGARLGYRTASGQAYAEIRISPQNTQDIKVALRIPPFAYAFSQGTHELQYRVQTVRTFPRPDPFSQAQVEPLDDILLPQTITAEFNRPASFLPGVNFRWVSSPRRPDEESLTLGGRAEP